MTIDMIPQRQRQLERRSQPAKADPVLLCAADDHYARPLTVMLHSAVSHLRPGAKLHVILMDGGLGDASWAALKETLANWPLELTVIRPDRAQVEDLVTSHHITHTAYFRLLAAELLPDWLDKVIYLDSDVLVRDDLSWLWEQELNGQYCLAVPDIACPFMDARIAGENRRKANPYMASLAPVANWRALGLRGDANYFNSGVMVLNLKRWRDEQISRRLLSCLREHSRHVWCWDQYALNVVFADHWGQLPARWNQGAHVFEYPSVECSPIEAEAFLAMRDDPAVIHFTTEWKPWQHRPYHPLADQFFQALDQTAWQGWRPEIPGFRLREAWDAFALKMIKQATIWYRRSTGGRH